ncbi:uncharacterized protein F4822DRAFT_75198 [Hypoxylon trugodes]|uniref:uncharacterized protein n=1 Tax=Hypoxylon trugodes TaxID=326681 RepID=UPI00219CA1AE|nr:uncharacterized protein F4822DRAFT_75198 [Hypoxylon trugodes]KAI1383359.1 hypothetical protein F4822DRAFT_75198 [Hypoxylon trugodes]
MPLISTATATVRTHAVVRADEESPSMTSMDVPQTSDFVLSSNTCGFTTASAITCGLGYECTNVGDFRGCCLSDEDDCSSTIYTTCIDYTAVYDSADCGGHTLCCPERVPHCFTYAFTTDNEPGATLKLVECNPSQGFGELFPYPPELTMTPDISSTDSGSPSNPSSPTDTDSSNSSISGGAIAGIVVGAVLGIILIAIVVAFICRSQRKKQHQAPAVRPSISPPLPIKTTDSSPDSSPTVEKDQARARAVATVEGAGVGAGAEAGPAKTKSRRSARRSFLRPLSMIREQPSPIPGARSNGISPVSPTGTTRQSYGLNWPLVPSSPLASHPVDETLKKRLSDGRFGLMNPPGPDGAGLGQRLPALQLASLTSGNMPTRSLSSTSASTRGPRQPFSSIGGRVNKAMDRYSADSVLATGSTSASAMKVADPEPVSPIESEEEEPEDVQRFSFVSVPSAKDEIVSPLEADGG